VYQLAQTNSVIRLVDGAFIPADPQNSDWQVYQQWLANGGKPKPLDAPTPEQIQNQIVSDTQKRLDDFARTRNYDGILSACTYATSSNAKFASEGQYCVEARDATWAKLYDIYEEVKAGTRPMPSGYDAIKGELPVLEWPDA
jgi:hypothetical protein